MRNSVGSKWKKYIQVVSWPLTSFWLTSVSPLGILLSRTQPVIWIISEYIFTVFVHYGLTCVKTWNGAYALLSNSSEFALIGNVGPKRKHDYSEFHYGDCHDIAWYQHLILSLFLLFVPSEVIAVRNIKPFFSFVNFGFSIQNCSLHDSQPFIFVVLFWTKFLESSHENKTMHLCIYDRLYSAIRHIIMWRRFWEWNDATSGLQIFGKRCDVR